MFLVIWGVLDVRKRAATSEVDFGVHKTDLTVFTGSGAVFYTDSDPYEYENPRFWKYCYLPMLALVMAPLDALGTQEQAVIWQATVYGGVGQGKKVAALRRGVDILIATPGRLLDLMDQGHLKLGNVEMFVLDEADRMLDMGFLPALRNFILELRFGFIIATKTSIP